MRTIADVSSARPTYTGAIWGLEDLLLREAQVQHARTLSQMLQAAEEWGLTTYGQKMSALLNQSARRDDTGAMHLTVRLYRSWLAPKTSPPLEPVVCAVTLEPDGRVRCGATDDLLAP